MTPVEDGKADFIQDRHDVYRDQWDRILQWGKQTGLNPACHMGEWTFMAQEQVRVSGWKMNNRKHGGGGGFWRGRPNKILAAGRPGGQRSPGGVGGG